MRYQDRQRSRGLEKWLRKNATTSEKHLWLGLRGLSFKFRRQHRIGSFVVDFYCPEVRLAIEVDGSAHSGAEAIAHDRERDAALRRIGVSVLHFTNAEVLGRTGDVVSTIEDVCFFL